MNKLFQHLNFAQPVIQAVRATFPDVRLLLLLPLIWLGTGLHLKAQTDCCDQNSGKPQKLTLRYTGQGCNATNTTQSTSKYSCQDVGGGPNGDPAVYIVASSGVSGSGKIYFSGNVAINTTFTANSQNGGDSNFPSNTYFTVYSSLGGAVLQNVKIHTSCSAPLIPGEQIGSLFLVSAEWPNGALCGPATPPESCPEPEITVVIPNSSSTTTVCKGDAITFSTTDLGFPCITYSWNFGTGATPATATGIGPHTVTYSNSGSVNVKLTIDNDCEGGTGTTVCPAPPPPPVGSDCCPSYSGKPKKITLKYTGQSCAATNTSQDPGKYSCEDLSGGPNNDPNVYIKVAEKDDGTGKVYFTGNVAINANFSADAGLVSDNELRSNTWVLVYSSQGGTLLQRVKIHTSCSAPLVPGEQFGSLNLISAQWSNGGTCDINSTGSGSGSGGADCCDQGDKPNSLTITYNGESCSNTSTSQDPGKYSCSDTGNGPNGDPSVYIVVAEKNDGTGKIYFTGNVAINSTFTASSANAGEDDFNSNTWFLVYSSQGGSLLQKVSIHTSCSAPIVAGDQFGSLVLESATFKNGITCGPVTPPGPDCIDCNASKTINITVENCQPVVGKVGDFVWEDTNGNGIQDPGEPGIPAAFVMLMTCQGGFVASTFTDGNGMYMFNNLAAGSYKVFFANPNGNIYMPTSKDQGNDDAKDSDAASNGWTECFTLGQGQTNLTIDAGFKRLGPPPCSINLTISNIVCDGKGTATTTDDTYTFVVNATGTGTGSGYFVDFSNACIGAAINGPIAYNTPVTLGPFPAGEFVCGVASPPIVYQNGLDIQVSVSDAQNSNCRTSTVVVSPGPCSPSAPASLGDFVWNDLNKNGQQDANEPGVQGVTVKLFKCDGTFVSQTSTNSAGLYSFTNLTANMQYYVEFSNLPTNFVFTTPNAAADNVDSDANQSNGRTDCVFLAPGDNNTTLDAGIFSVAPALGSIGDFVWNDQNNNGIQDPNEPGVGGVTVRLKNCNNAVIAVTTTLASGFYVFPDLPAGCYRVAVDLPSGFVFSPADQGNDDSKDSDIIPGTGMTNNINLATGENNPTIDAGIYKPAPQPASVGDFVWNDLNKNGIQDEGEPGVQGVLVKLFTCNNTFIGQFTTNANGFYQFINLQAGSYYLEFSNLPAGFQFTAKDAGTNDAKDSDVSPANGKTDCFSLTSGQYDPTRDAGIFQSTTTGPAKIGDFVWFDTNANGIQDPNEPGIPGIFVILETCSGAYKDFAVTNASGIYMFNNVQPGQYRIKFASPGTYNGVPVQFTVKDAGNDDTKDSDADWLGFTACFTVNPGDNNLTFDAGLTGETPPPVCVFNGTASNIVCNDNGTPNNPGDDTYTFTLVANGSNTGEWGYDIPSLGLYTLQYGQPYNLGPFNISAGTLTLLLNDHDVANCTSTLTVQPPAPCSSGGGSCDNVTNAGTIGYNESQCQSYDPANIVSLTSPSGGTGQLEYIWLKSTEGCPDDISQIIPGATGASYNPPPITQTTWYVRCARRVGCSQWIESNCVKKEVCTPTGGGCNITFASGPGSITISGLNAPNVDVKVFNSNWQKVFSCFNNCNNPQVVNNLPAGTYFVDVQMWNASWQPVCSKKEYVTVSSLLQAPGGINQTEPSAVTTDKSADDLAERSDRQFEALTKFGATAEMKLFPNPASGYVMLEWTGAEANQPAVISLLNQLGQVVKIIRLDDASVSAFKLDLNDFRSGQYMVHFQLQGEIPMVKKLAVSH